jgi:hypothetical protein
MAGSTVVYRRQAGYDPAAGVSGAPGGLRPRRGRIGANVAAVGYFTGGRLPAT